MPSEHPTPEEVLRTIPTPEWLIEMHEHYTEHGTYRAEDIIRVLGDQTKAVVMGNSNSMENNAIRFLDA